MMGIRARCRAQAGHRTAVAAAAVGLCIAGVTLGPAPAGATAQFAAQLTRAPYLSDLVGTHVAINFATDRSASTASVKYASVDGSGGCTPTTTASTTRTSITVGTVHEYQWTASLDLAAAGSYCYRVYLGSVDLLAGASSPRFTTQAPAGSSAPFTFDVLGDWGQVDSTGASPDQTNLIAQIAASGARFAVTVGDNGYPNGSQTNYGDLQQVGAGTSAIFGPGGWPVAGSSTPIFTAAGNHGLSGPAHTDITTWTQARAVSSSGGRYQDDVYCCVNGSTSSHYGSEWYAFDAGPARFYLLDSAWGDTNKGTASPYANDAAAHFAPGTPEYTWLTNDLQNHPSQLKFAFSHYPFHADSPTEGSDTFLDGNANLEGLLGRNGVQLVFNGHMHAYQRNNPAAPGLPVTYTTGGGGGTLEPVGPCTTVDAYAIGWSPTKSKGYACGAATPPTAAANVYHFLRVTVAGTTVTVAPTDSRGNTFDVHTYTFSGPPETYLDSTPPSLTASTSGTFAFHSSDAQATFGCALDGASSSPCTSPFTVTGLADGMHTMSIAATSGSGTDPTPATYSWRVDTAPPSTPTGLVGQAQSAVAVALGWNASSDNVAVGGYELYRDGSAYQHLGAVTSYQDAVSAGSTHTYAVSALDTAGNESAQSAPVTVTTSTQAPPVFSDGFEGGNLKAWTTSGGLTVESATVRSGQFAAESSSASVAGYAKKTLPGTYADGYARTGFNVVSLASQENLLRLRAADTTSIGYVYVTTAGKLAFHNDARASNTVSATAVGSGWHMLELHVKVDSASGTATGTVEVWLDGQLVSDLSSTAVDVAAAPIGAMQVGDVQVGRSFDVAFDDAAFGTARLGSQSAAGAVRQP